MSARPKRENGEIEAQGQVFAACPGVDLGLRGFLRQNGGLVRKLLRNGGERWHGDDVGRALEKAGLLWGGKAVPARRLSIELFKACGAGYRPGSRTPAGKQPAPVAPLPHSLPTPPSLAPLDPPPPAVPRAPRDPARIRAGPTEAAAAPLLDQAGQLLRAELLNPSQNKD